jgi:putative ABC transport system permease protein
VRGPLAFTTHHHVKLPDEDSPFPHGFSRPYGLPWCAHDRDDGTQRSRAVTLAGLAAKNLLRHRFRSVMTLLGLSIASLTFVLLRTTLTAWYAGATQGLTDRIGTRNRVSLTNNLPHSYSPKVRALPGVTASSFAIWFNGKDPRHPNYLFNSYAVEVPTTFGVYPDIVLTDEEKQAWLADRQGAIVGDVLARNLGLRKGDRVTLRGTAYPGNWTFDIVAVYRAGSISIDRTWFLFNWDYLNESLPEARRGQVQWIISRIDDPSRSAEIARAIDRQFAREEVPTITMTEKQALLSLIGFFSSVLRALEAMSIGILVIMVLILGNTMSMSVRERIREYAVLRALGFSSGQVSRLIFTETTILSVLGGVLGLAGAQLATALVVRRIVEDQMGHLFPQFEVTSQTAVVVVLVSGAVGLVAAIVPSFQVARMPLLDALRRVE